MTSRAALRNFIDGRWVSPDKASEAETINPATGRPSGRVLLSGPDQIDAAVRAARKSFSEFSQTSVSDRQQLLANICEAYEKRKQDIADAIVTEIGAPTSLALQAHANVGQLHFAAARTSLDAFSFEETLGQTCVKYEPIGVCGLITPWNWPTNQLAAKVAPALATGCTMVLKPSELAPYSADMIAEILQEAGVPAGVFNLVHGEGETVGRAIASHDDIDMVSFTGSTRAGIEVAREAAASVKRVHQELGGKSPNIVLPDADIAQVAEAAVKAIVSNAGQSCNAPTRLFVPVKSREKMESALSEALASVTVGPPESDPDCGPVVSERQYERVQALIRSGIEQGARILGGGSGKPDGLENGFYIRPTIFTDVTNDMEIARTEIFGPVLCILAYESLEEAIALANDTPYGLAAYIQGKNKEILSRVASQLRAGQVQINRPPIDPFAPFGGYKQSGNGREFGKFGFEAYLETKAIMGL